MSDFDDHNQRRNDDLFRHQTDGPFGGLTYGEVVSNQAFAQLYGLETHNNDIFTADSNVSVSEDGKIKLVWYLVLAQAIGVAAILFFTFMF